MSLVPTTQKVSKVYLKRVFQNQEIDIFGKVAAVLAVRKVARVDYFRSILKKRLGSHAIAHMGFVVPSDSNPEEVIVYPNFKPGFQYAGYDALEVQLDMQKPIQTVIDQIKKDLLDKKTAIKWETSERGLKWIMKKQRISLYRYLREYLKLNEHGYKDNDIRDVGLYIMARLGEPKVVVCTKPDDYVEQFKTPTGSCMQWRDDFVNEGCHHGAITGKKWNELKEKYNAFPSTFYHYIPGVTGVYVLDGNNKPAARAFLFGDKNHSSIYGAFSAVLQAHFTKQVLTRKSFKITQDFTVPGYELEGVFNCPLPHMDDISKGFYVKFNKVTNEFEVSPKNNGGVCINDTYIYKGYLQSTQC